VSERKASYE